MPQGSSGEWASGDGMDVAAVESDVLTRVRPLLVDDQRCPEVKFLRATRQRRLPSASNPRPHYLRFQACRRWTGARTLGARGGPERVQQKTSSSNQSRIQCPGHSITVSARAKSEAGTSSPSAFNVLTLTTISNFVARSTGSSVGLLPFKILSTCVAARRNMSGKSTP